MGSIILLVAAGTLYESFSSNPEKSYFGRFWTRLSLIYNSRLLFHQKSSDSRQEKISTRDLEHSILSGLKWLNGVQMMALLGLIVSNVYLLGGLPLAFIISMYLLTLSGHERGRQ